MAGLSLIRTPAGWQEYIRSYQQRYGLAAGQVQWGQGPEHFPCLVASILAGPGKIVSCYVYPEQAQALLAVSREMGRGPAATDQGPIQEAAVRTLVKHEVHAQLGQSIREIAANLRAIVEELVAVGVTTPERYETLLAKHAADVDQYLAEVKEGRARLGDGAPDRVLRRIMPEDDCPGK